MPTIYLCKILYTIFICYHLLVATIPVMLEYVCAMVYFTLYALRKDGLAPSVFPTMGELWGKQDEKLEKNKEWEVSVKKNRNVYFCVAYSRYFSTAIYMVIDRLKNSFNLTWLRVRMSHHRYNNLEELLNGDLVAKIGRGIFSKDLSR